MISATLRYRDYVDQWTIAIKFADLNFNGEEHVTELLKDLIHLIYFEKYNKQKAKIECLKELKSSNNSKIEILQSETASLKAKYKLVIFNKEVYEKIKQYKKEIERLSWLNQNIDWAIQNLEDDCFFDVYDLKSKYKNLLAKLGFSSKNSYYKSNNDICIEVYEFNKDEEKLARIVRNMIADLEETLNEEIEFIKKHTNEKITAKNVTPLEILQEGGYSVSIDL